jgi:hypothetical protein
MQTTSYLQYIKGRATEPGFLPNVEKELCFKKLIATGKKLFTGNGRACFWSHLKTNWSHYLTAFDTKLTQ